MACNGELHTTRIKHYFGELFPHVFSLVTVFSLFSVILYYLNNADRVRTGLKNLFEDIFTETDINFLTIQKQHKYFPCYHF